MLKEIHLTGSVRTPFHSFCAAFVDVSPVELGKAALERSGVKPEDLKELLVGNILSGAAGRTSRASASGRAFVGGGMGIAIALELT